MTQQSHDFAVGSPLLNLETHKEPRQAVPQSFSGREGYPSMHGNVDQPRLIADTVNRYDGLIKDIGVSAAAFEPFKVSD